MKKHSDRQGKNVAYIILSHAPVIVQIANSYKEVDTNSRVFSKYCSAFEIFVRGDEEVHAPQGVTTEVHDFMARSKQ